MRKIVFAVALACAMATRAYAAPGMGDEIYGATVEKGDVELESRYGTLAGGPDDGEDVVKLEAAYGVSSRLRIAAFGEFEKEAGASRKGEEVGSKPSTRSATPAASISRSTANMRSGSADMPIRSKPSC